MKKSRLPLVILSIITILSLILLGFFFIRPALTDKQEVAHQSASTQSPFQIDEPKVSLVPPQDESPEQTGTQEPKTQGESIKINAVGDIMFARYIGQKIESQGGELPFKYVSKYFKADEINIANLENPLYKYDPPKAKPKSTSNEATSSAAASSQESSAATAVYEPIILCGNPKAIEGLSAANINLVSLANNHAMDKGAEGIQKTLELLDSKNIMHAGAGMNVTDAQEAAVFEHRGNSVCFISASNIIPAGYLASKQSPGIAGARTNIKSLLKQVKDAKAKGQIVLVAIHWGVEYQDYPLDKDKTFARSLVDAGADALICHHPHVLQGVELYKEKPIIYSLGNFIFDIYHSHADESVIAHLELNPDGSLESLSFSPIRIKGGIPAPATGDDAVKILERFSDLSKSLGSDFEIQDQKLVLRSQ